MYSPFSSPDTEGGQSDNTRIPIIPITPIEATVEAEMPFDSSPLVDIPINSKPPASPRGSSISENLPLSQNNRSGLESVDLEVALAAAATVAAVMQSKEKIDTELLIKLLAEPETVKKLMDKNGFIPKPEHATPTSAPAPEGKTAFPLPSSASASVVDKISDIPKELLSRTVPSNSSLQTVNEVRKAINKSASKQGDIHVVHSPICTSKPPEEPSPLGRSNPGSPPIKKLTTEPRGPAPGHSRGPAPGHSNFHRVAVVKQVRPLMPLNLRSNEETGRRSVNQYGATGIAWSGPVATLNPSTSITKTEEIKKMINEYGSHGSAGIKPVAPLNSATSRSLNFGAMERMRNEYGVSGHGWFKPFMEWDSSSPASTTPTPDQSFLSNTLRSNFTSTGNFHVPSYSNMSIPSPPVDLNYYQSLIKQYGENHDTQEHKLLNYREPGHYFKGLELGHKTTSIETDPKYEKPCVYFSSPKGCRNGFSCPYWHDVANEWRTGGNVEVRVAKRMKFTG